MILTGGTNAESPLSPSHDIVAATMSRQHATCSVGTCLFFNRPISANSVPKDNPKKERSFKKARAGTPASDFHDEGTPPVLPGGLGL